MKHLYFHLKKDPEDEVVAINGIKWGNLWPVPLVNNSELETPLRSLVKFQDFVSIIASTFNF